MIHTNNNQSITREERPFVETLAAFTARPEVLAEFQRAQRRAADALRSNMELATKVETIDFGAFRNAPQGIGSIRVAVIRAGFDGGNERHPNSTQYLFSLEGSGETYVHTQEGWRRDTYGTGAQIEDRFHVVPLGVWHKSAAPGPRDWTVVALHTAVAVQDDYDYPG